MLVRYMSDLHLEFGILPHLPNPADVLILAGDLNTKARVAWLNAQVPFFKHILYVAGNHEFYKGHLHFTKDKIRKNLDPKIHFLDNESVTINGTTFHGATLWTDFDNQNPISMIKIHAGLNDFKQIRTKVTNVGDYVWLTPQRLLPEFMISKLFLQESIKPGDVVITHHAPSFRSVSDEFKCDELNGAYASNLDELIYTTKPSYWIHGHMHNSNDYTINHTRILSNPYGYHNHAINPEFDINKSFVI